MFGQRKTISDWEEQGDRTKAAIRSYFELIDPRTNVDSAKEVAEIVDKISHSGEWVKDDEWRISTWTKVTIRQEWVNEKQWFGVTVECDGQSLACRCPSVERAFMFYKFYAHTIIYGTYSVGPPWAG